MTPSLWVGILAMAAMLTATFAAPASAQLSEDDVKSQLASEFGVEVLKIVPTSGPSGPAYEVTVMNPAGDSNAAFQVNTLLIDRRTGKLLSAFRHLPAGYELGGGRSFEPGDAVSGEAARRRSFEGRR